jgi:hypothetical protein
MEEVPPPFGGSSAKEEFASHPVARVASYAVHMTAVVFD